MRSTVGDLDILVAAKDSAAVMEAFVKLPRVTRVLGKGEFKSSIEFTDGVRAQVWVHPPKEFGTALSIRDRLERSQRVVASTRAR
ncbi:MAG: hypothetical protein U0V48_04400 [Anaerolineales bacterium]